ncbi:MAG: type II toxin-antitoxin system HigB family toxin [Allomuricauda sp.]|uniref:type II toxin-antitoxin system HigB family toxin n=1 Tax=Sinomicrobium oceani TaxID=1150368 RepID=UPI00227CD568|nr:type II toxin-antitoxin system HigB family toxin [Sinomicrobium oceani]|tara:strand:+ start:290 stop:583 length:294 start_codon:yes stop_codon:yes gene_type:complete
MRIFSRSTLSNFWKEHPRAEKPLRAFYSIVKNTEFKNSNEVIALFNTADVVKDGKIVFNICRNDYRLIVKFNYQKHAAFIRFIGTHKEYDKLDIDSL